jgi:hypothetical protein
MHNPFWQSHSIGWGNNLSGYQREIKGHVCVWNEVRERRREGMQSMEFILWVVVVVVVVVVGWRPL